MELTGRVTGDAKVRTVKGGREVLVFTVVENRYYKTKDGEKKNDATFFNCSYWVSMKIAGVLRKGSIVSLYGHVGLNAYKGSDGEYHSTLIFHVNNIQILSSGKKTETSAVEAGVPKEDLPF